MGNVIGNCKSCHKGNWVMVRMEAMRLDQGVRPAACAMITAVRRRLFP